LPGGGLVNSGGIIHPWKKTAAKAQSLSAFGALVRRGCSKTLSLGVHPLDLDHFRSYLLLLARIRLDRKLQGKLDASDIVQQTMMEAHQALESFRGENVAAQAAWLRQILARNLANAVRDLTREKRDVGRERSLQAGLDESASHLEGWLVADQSSPSQQAERHERALLLAQALANLPDQQREAVVLRHFHGCSLAEIAEELDSTTTAITGLLHRGMKRLRSALKELGEP
jgi:RNA polymerase sigma-70 factor (ECF subfamily)